MKFSDLVTLAIALAIPISAWQRDLHYTDNLYDIDDCQGERFLESIRITKYGDNVRENFHYAGVTRQMDEPQDDIADVLKKPDDRKSWAGAAQPTEEITDVEVEIVVPKVFHAGRDKFEAGGQAWVGIDGYAKCKISIRTGVAWKVSKRGLPKYVAFIEVGKKRIHEFNLAISPADKLEFKLSPDLGLAPGGPVDMKVAINNKSAKLYAELSVQSLLGWGICKIIDKGLETALGNALDVSGKEKELILEGLSRVCEIGADYCLDSAEFMVSKIEEKIEKGQRKVIEMARYENLMFRKMSVKSRKSKKTKLFKPKMFKHEEGFFNKDVSACKVNSAGDEMECKYKK